MSMRRRLFILLLQTLTMAGDISNINLLLNTYDTLFYDCTAYMRYMSFACTDQSLMVEYMMERKFFRFQLSGEKYFFWTLLRSLLTIPVSL